MTRKHGSAVILSCLVLSFGALAGPEPTGPYPKAPSDYGTGPGFDARYIHDLYYMSSSIVSSTSVSPLAFCMVHPNPLAGYSIGHATYDRKHDTYIDNGPQESESDFGTFQVFDSLSGLGFPASGTYRWDSRQGGFEGSYNSEDPPDPYYYSIHTDPFQSGGIAVLPLPVGKRLTKYPAPFTLLRGYVEFAKGEARFRDEHPLSFSSPHTDAEIQAERDLLKSPNPLVALESTKLLAKAGLLRPAEVVELTGSVPVFRRALLVAGILATIPEDQRGTIGQAMITTLNRETRPEDLRPVVVGATVAEHILYDMRRHLDAARFAHSVAQQACDAQKKLYHNQRADSYTAFLMSTM